MNIPGFSELYKSLSNADLLEIIETHGDYQPLAVEAANSEFDNRQLSPEDLLAARSECDGRKQKKEDEKQRNKALEEKIKLIGTNVIDTFNPIQKTPTTIEKYIKLISLFLAAISLFSFITQFSMLKFMFTDHNALWDLSVIGIYLVPIVIPLIAGALFWYRKKAGWLLGIVHFTYTAGGQVSMFIIELHSKPSGFAALDSLFPQTSPAVYVLTFVLFGVVALTMCKSTIREIYAIDNRLMFGAIAVGAAFPLVMTLMFFK